MESRSVAHQDAGMALESQSGWFVEVPARAGRGNGIPNFMVPAMTVVAMELLLTTIAKGLGET